MVNHSSRRQQRHHGGGIHTGTGCRPNASAKEVNHAMHAKIMGSMLLGALYALTSRDAFATMNNKCMRKKGDGCTD